MVPIPIPIPLKYVNCYLCKGPSGWTLVDAGFHDDLAEDAWPRAFDELGIRYQDVDRILVTHHHPDHIGAAGWLQQLCSAPAYIPDLELSMVELFWGSGNPDQSVQTKELFEGHGMPEEIASGLAKTNVHHRGLLHPLPHLTPVPAGSRLRIGAAEYDLVWTPGHSDGLTVFFNRDTGVLFANDMILNKITPNVSLWPECRPNPLEDYLNSLATVGDLHAKVGLPGHRSIIENVTVRAAEIREHHAYRLAVMERACGGLKGATAWEVCEQTFRPATLTLHQVRFAMSETLAHLVYMEHQGRLLFRGGRYVQA